MKKSNRKVDLIIIIIPTLIILKKKEINSLRIIL